MCFVSFVCFAVIYYVEVVTYKQAIKYIRVQVLVR